MFQTGPLQVRSALLVSHRFSTVFPLSHYSPLCLIPFLSASQSNLFLFFFFCAPGTVQCCLTSPLITAPQSPPSTSRLTCESTRPRAGITLKSYKSGHVKLTEVFREPTQVSEGVSWKLAQGQICMSKYTRWFRLQTKVGPKHRKLIQPRGAARQEASDDCSHFYHLITFFFCTWSAVVEEL